MTEGEFLRVLDVVDAVKDSERSEAQGLTPAYWWHVACERVKERLRTEFEGKLT